jgi:hypothetical protein
MKPSDIGRAIVYPLIEPAVLVPLLVFWLLISFALWGGVLGLFLLFLVIPAVFRFQMIVLEARARGVEPATPDVEFFNWFGNAWSLFPVPISILLIWAILASAENFGLAAAGGTAFLASVFFPASLAVLAITRSPLQSLSPVAITRLLGRCAGTLWIATAFLFISCWLVYLSGQMPAMLGSFVQLLLSFSFFSLVGSLIEPLGIVDEVYIPDALEKSATEVGVDIEKHRTDVLTHAYGFISRDNREGGFRHLIADIGKDSDPAAAWAWYFDRMLGWENQQHALFFAQHYVHDALRHGEDIAALKVIMRSRLVSAAFKPFPADRQAAVAAAERHRNIELVDVLKWG